MTAVLKPHKVEVSDFPAGGYQIKCSGCGHNWVRGDEPSTKVVVDRHNTLNAQQFKAYSNPGRGAEGESSN